MFFLLIAISFITDADVCPASDLSLMAECVINMHLLCHVIPVVLMYG